MNSLCKTVLAHKARDEDVLEIDGITLNGMEKSVGSTLKSKAIHLAKTARAFSNLTGEAKNTVFLGLNSIVDLSNSYTGPDSQRSLFSESSWQQLKNLVYESRDMPPLPDDVTNELKDIEKIYAHDSFVEQKNSILQTDRGKKATEQDFVNEAWTPILATNSTMMNLP
ncbi:uncharacterized protein EV154DRAFT_510422 [Mucor mucedo]|uniref:uncharacterized protein n=1 Tax=Mucor mucedo TaxID=29922 RepID=UPI00221F8031|nr:uncharacterized protein EV154DRAFT_510422 [Mucor mucedo]KAI7890861.1 hypothetical protein EV154DRAFT_510422 [Mucor mucedo]